MIIELDKRYKFSIFQTKIFLLNFQFTYINKFMLDKIIQVLYIFILISNFVHFIHYILLYN